jgi:hypothetical protein
MTEKVWIPLTKSLITALLVLAFAASWFIPAVMWKLVFGGISGISLLVWVILIFPDFPDVGNLDKTSKSPTGWT